MVSLLGTIGGSSYGMEDSQKELSAGQSLDEYQRFIQRCDRCRFKISVTHAWDSPIRSSWQGEVVRDGNSRFLQRFISSASFPQDGKQVTEQEGSEYNVIGSTK